MITISPLKSCFKLFKTREFCFLMQISRFDRLSNFISWWILLLFLLLRKKLLLDLKNIYAIITGMQQAGGLGGPRPPQILADQKVPPGSGGAPHYYRPPRIFDPFCIPELHLLLVPKMKTSCFILLIDGVEKLKLKARSAKWRPL